MMNTVKTAITIPKEDFIVIETLRRKSGKSRSRILVEAFHAWLKSRRNEEVEAAYEKGYREKPENIKEISTLMKASLPLLDTEKW